MRKKRYFRMFVPVLFLLFVLLLTAGCGKPQEESRYHIAYLNKDKTGIVEVPYEMKTTTTETMIEEFFAALCAEPDDVDYRKPIPSDVEITKYSLDGALLTIYFDADYLNMNEVEEVLCRAAIVRTVTQITGVDCVNFYVDETPLTDAEGRLVGTM